MVARRASVKLTANFEANLASIEAFWIEAEAPESYDRLLDHLLETVIPSLGQFPKMGRQFLSRRFQSVEAQATIERLQTRTGADEIREYLIDDYLILYAPMADAVYLLSIRHHRQLSFDLERFWPKS
jgi:plasmid stabilization system protein ParE